LGTIQHVRLEREPEADSLDATSLELLRFCAPDGSYFLPDAELREARRRGLELRVLRSISDADVPVEFVLPHDGAVCNPPPEDARLAVLARLLSEERAGGDLYIRFLGRNRTVPPDGFRLDRAGGRRRYAWQVIPATEVRASTALLDRFSAVRALFADPDTRVALSLGSGGLKLFAHAAVLRFLEGIACADHIDELWGSSGGAIAGLLYSLGLSPQAIEQSGYDIYSGRYNLALRPSKLRVLRHLVRETLFSGPGEAGFHDGGGPLTEMLQYYCASLRPRRPFYTVAFNLAECRTQVLTAEPVPGHLAGWFVQTDPREAVLASSAVPLLFVPQTIQQNDRETPYIDGSTTEDVPLHSIVKKWDRDREAGQERRGRLAILYVKLTGSLAQYRTTHGRIGKLRLMQLVASAGIETMHRRDVEIAQRRSDVELLGLTLGDTGPDFFEVERIPEFVRMAKERFPLQLAAIENGLRSR
jgi:predicted acylesterase/phospholipase RssA